MRIERAELLGQVAARRLSADIRATAQSAAARHAIHPQLVAAFLATEMLERGGFARWIEAFVARLRLRLKRDAAVEEMSVGIAQIRPSSLSRTLALEDRVAELLTPEHAVDHCARVLRRLCHDLGLQPADAHRYRPRDWHRLGFAYNGTYDYGDVARAVFFQLVSSGTGGGSLFRSSASSAVGVTGCHTWREKGRSFRLRC